MESANDFANDMDKNMLKPLDVVCFGVLSAMRVATVEEYPEADSGATILSLMELMCADAVITSVILDGLGWLRCGKRGQQTALPTLPTAPTATAAIPTLPHFK
jgi:hypothetical protein